MGYKVTATFQAEEVKGETRSFYFTTRKEADECVEAGMASDKMMTDVIADWRTDYTIEETDELPLDMVKIIITYPDGEKVEREYSNREEAEETLEMLKDFDQVARLIAEQSGEKWDPQYEIVDTFEGKVVA